MYMEQKLEKSRENRFADRNMNISQSRNEEKNLFQKIRLHANGKLIVMVEECRLEMARWRLINLDSSVVVFRFLITFSIEYKYRIISRSTPVYLY